MPRLTRMEDSSGEEDAASRWVVFPFVELTPFSRLHLLTAPSGSTSSSASVVDLLDSDDSDSGSGTENEVIELLDSDSSDEDEDSNEDRSPRAAVESNSASSSATLPGAMDLSDEDEMEFDEEELSWKTKEARAGLSTEDFRAWKKAVKAKR